MTWLRLDDQFARHRKVAPLSDRAWRLHVTALLECCANLTDGQIDLGLPGTWPSAPRGKSLAVTIGELVLAGLWEPVDGGWIAHDFLHWNPSGAEVKAERQVKHEAKVAAGKKGGKASANVRAKGKQTPSNDPSKTEAEHQADTQAEGKQKGSPVPVPVPVPVPAATAAPERSSSDQKVPCPVPLPLDGDDLARLQELGIQPDVAEANLRAWATAERVAKSPERTVEAWVKCGVKALMGKWSDSSRRAEMRAIANPAPEPAPPRTKPTEELNLL